jgi:hypothetical protein
MTNVGSFGDELWGSAPAPDDAEALLGAFAQSPFIAVAALFLLAVAFVLARAGAAPSESERAPAPHLPASGLAQLHVTSSPSVSWRAELLGQGAYPKPSQASTQDSGQTDTLVRSHARAAGVSLHEERGRLLDLRLLRTTSSASVERGPPIPTTVLNGLGRKLTDKILLHPDGRGIARTQGGTVR